MYRRVTLFWLGGGLRLPYCGFKSRLSTISVLLSYIGSFMTIDFIFVIELCNAYGVDPYFNYSSCCHLSPQQHL